MERRLVFYDSGGRDGDYLMAARKRQIKKNRKREREREREREGRGWRELRKQGREEEWESCQERRKRLSEQYEGVCTGSMCPL